MPTPPEFYDQALRNSREQRMALGELPLTATPVQFSSHRGNADTHASLVTKALADLVEVIRLRDEWIAALQKHCADLELRLTSIETTTQ